MISKAISYISTVVLVAIAGFFIWKYALGAPENLAETQEGLGDIIEKAGEKWDELDFTNVLDGLGDLEFGDLFHEGDDKPGSNTTISWKSSFIKPNDGGLHLTILNALDDTWQDAFAVAVSDWQESDALQLTIERVEVDPTCKRVEGVMVVCNANFGDKGWVGINENELKDDVIVSSVSKMNEFYLNNADDAQRQFTMCHELGHGYGLPHTDVNPYNKNLGNCLDYTDDPDENLDPGEVNMSKLRNMYLNSERLRSRRVESDGTIVETTQILAHDDRQ